MIGRHLLGERGRRTAILQPVLKAMPRAGDAAEHDAPLAERPVLMRAGIRDRRQRRTMAKHRDPLVAIDRHDDGTRRRQSQSPRPTRSSPRTCPSRRVRRAPAHRDMQRGDRQPAANATMIGKAGLLTSCRIAPARYGRRPRHRPDRSAGAALSRPARVRNFSQKSWLVAARMPSTIRAKMPKASNGKPEHLAIAGVGGQQRLEPRRRAEEAIPAEDERPVHGSARQTRSSRRNAVGCRAAAETAGRGAPAGRCKE